jgi:hypothetical protein
MEVGTMKKLTLLFLVLLGLLAACSKVNRPEQIAIYPKEDPIAIYRHFPEISVTYNATLDMEVSNVERATERVKGIAFEHGGYLVSIQSWFRDGEKHSTVILAVPPYQFDHTRDEILRLGRLNGEWISSELDSHGYEPGDKFAQITIYLHPREFPLPEVSLPKWRPVQTFQRALGVFASIFGFLLDIVIWIVVVAGPFVLIGFGAVKLYLWRKKTLNKVSRDPE